MCGAIDPSGRAAISKIVSPLLAAGAVALIGQGGAR
jgi:hypothetical protein